MKFTFFWIIIVTYQSFLSICQMALDNSCFNPANMSSSEFLPFLLYSGRNINDLGNYESCISSSDSRYLLANILIEQELISGYIGLCMPVQCDVNSTQALINADLPIIKEILASFNESIPINEIIITDPSQINQQKGFWFYFIIVLFILLGLLVIIGSILSFGQLLKIESNPRSLSVSYTESFPTDEGEVKPINETMVIKSLKCFDISSNLQKLFSINVRAEHDQDLGVLSGVRTLSFFYVIYGHEYIQRGIIATSFQNMESIIQDRWLVVVNAGFYAVDVFFFLSGFLFAFVMVGKLRKLNPNLKNYLAIVLHRYLRIMPLYFVVILIYWKISVYFGDGPLWVNNVSMINSSCNGSWWQHLLFIDNFWASFSNEAYCFAWGWYLACDFQLFLVSPFLVWIYVKNNSLGKKVVLGMTGLVMAISLFVAFDLKVKLFPATELADGSAFNWFYLEPYTRGCPYLFGLWLGLVYKESKAAKVPTERSSFINLIIRSRASRILLSLFGILIISYCTWIVTPLQSNENAWPDWLNYSWSAVERLLYPIGIAFLILPSLFGKNRLFKGLLNNGFFLVLARISYCGYLVHYFIMGSNAYASKQTMYMNDWLLFYDWIITTFLSIVSSILLIILVELPFANLEELFLRPRKIETPLKKPILPE